MNSLGGGGEGDESGGFVATNSQDFCVLLLLFGLPRHVFKLECACELHDEINLVYFCTGNSKPTENVFLLRCDSIG